MENRENINENKIEDTENTPSAFDPDNKAPEFYSKDPYQHGISDFGAPSEGVGVGTFNSVQPKDQGSESQRTSASKDENAANHEREAGPDNHGTTQEWDVDPQAIENSRRDAANQPANTDSGWPSSIEGIPDNPSDEALFNRQGATYLEEGDNPKEGYDPHHMGYDNKDDSTKEEDKS
ncbi:hypothetical protein [Tellurirhabdus bombi]|uniref:hypothetical protein n=1 Tax=Tellurirhabdus bombi TaxID=2907205 RepID=UPI001F30D9CE|nr:hypothetical protein [Tellurirhabdus bombi]